MKKLLVPLVVGMMALPATAATMQCMISGVASWSDGYCFGMEFTMDYNTNPASWRIVGATKPISSVTWANATQAVPAQQPAALNLSVLIRCIWGRPLSSIAMVPGKPFR